MPRRPAPDPSQQAPRSRAKRPGDDGEIGAAIARVPARQPQPVAAKPSRTRLSDDELLSRPWRVLAGHVGNWAEGKVIPPGTFADPTWVRELLRRSFIAAVED